MMHYLISLLVSFGFWGKATQETEEKTEKSSWLRTSIYFILTIFVCALFYKTYQVQQSSWLIFVSQGKGAFNKKGECLDTVAIMVRKFITAHDSAWMKSRNEEYCWSGINFKYICSNDSDAIYKTTSFKEEFFPLRILGNCLSVNLPNSSMPGYMAIEKLKNDINTPGPMQLLLQKVNAEQKLEPWEKYVIRSYEDSLMSNLAAAYRVAFLVGRPESLIPYSIKKDTVLFPYNNYPLVERINNIDVETIQNGQLHFSFLNGQEMSLTENIDLFKESDLLNGDLIDVTAFVPKDYVRSIPKGMKWHSDYYANSAEYSTDFFSAFDLSQSTQLIQIQSEVPVGMLQIIFDIPIELVGCYPQPDRIGTNEIGFIDPQKTKEISQRGVNFHVKYPTMENKQLIRSLLLTTLLTAIVSLFLANLYHSSRKTIISIKEKYNITITKKFQYFINTLIILLLGGISYYSYILIFNDKVLISESDIWYYISSVIVGVFLVLVSIFIAYKKLK